MDEERLMRLREQSGIRLDKDGFFFHEGRLVEHPRVVRAFHRGLRRADDGRPTLHVARTWCFIEVEDTLFRVEQALMGTDGGCLLTLNDETQEPLRALALSPEGVLYARVKEGQEWARFSVSAQASLGSRLEEDGAGGFCLRLQGGEVLKVGALPG